MQEETQEVVRLSPLVDLPQELIIELAVGVGKFDDICRKHGYNTSEIEFLRESANLQRQVAKMESELTRDGLTHEYRARYVSDLALQEMTRRVTDPRTPTNTIIDIYKETTKTGNLQPKQNQVQAQGGGGYSITINIPQMNEQPGRTIEMNSSNVGAVDAEATPSMVMIVPDVGTVNRSLNSSLELPEDYQDE